MIQISLTFLNMSNWSASANDEYIFARSYFHFDLQNYLKFNFEK